MPKKPKVHKLRYFKDEEPKPLRNPKGWLPNGTWEDERGYQWDAWNRCLGRGKEK